MGGNVIVYMMRTVLEGQQTVFFIKGLWGLSVLATGPGHTVTAEYVHWSSTWRATETCSWLGPEQQPVPLKLQAEPPEMKLVLPGKAVDSLSHLGVLGGLNQADRQALKLEQLGKCPESSLPGSSRNAGGRGLSSLMAPCNMEGVF